MPLIRANDEVAELRTLQDLSVWFLAVKRFFSVESYNIECTYLLF